MRTRSTRLKPSQTLVREAAEANEEERKMSVMQALKLYPKAMMWSIVLSSAIIMEGSVHKDLREIMSADPCSYDTAVIGSCRSLGFASRRSLTPAVWAYPPFLDIFGVKGVDGKLTIPSSWQNGIGSGTSVGEIIGLQIAGVAANRIGYRYVQNEALR